MKSKKSLVVLILLISLTGTAQNRKKDVVDYFLLLPEEALNWSVDSRKTALNRKPAAEGQCGFVDIDRANGYLYFKCPGLSGGSALEIALWTEPGKPDIIGVNSMTCGQGSCYMDHIRFFEFRNNAFTDVTKSVFPGISPSDFQGPDAVIRGMIFCNLPKVGMNIICRNDKNSEVQYVWDKGRFHK